MSAASFKVARNSASRFVIVGPAVRETVGLDLCIARSTSPLQAVAILLRSYFAAALADHAADDQLSSREMDVLRLIGEGNANKQIADKLSIGETTVKNHISNILSKLGANDRAHAVTIALQRGIIELQVPQK
jgi:DNA-binding NarL/FixJ family response regulator